MRPNQTNRLLRWCTATATAMLLINGCNDSSSSSPTGPKSPVTPAPPAGDISGTWIGAYRTNDYVDCDTTVALPAQAIFQQSGSNVTGTLTANGPCGLGYAFAGTLSGNTLSGSISADGFGGGTAYGTLAGGNLTMNAFNMYGFNMGQLQVHR